MENEDELLNLTLNNAKALKEGAPFLSQNEAELISAAQTSFSAVIMQQAMSNGKLFEAFQIVQDFANLLGSLVKATEERCMGAKELRDAVNGADAN